MKIKRTISSKKEVDRLLEAYQPSAGRPDTDGILEYLFEHLLTNKVKFPIAEYATVRVFEGLTDELIAGFAETRGRTGEISLYPFLGKLFHLMGPGNANAWKLSGQTMVSADCWYACDTISERVFGEALITDFQETANHLKKLINSDNIWLQRAPGIATHYAVKRLIPWKACAELVEILQAQFTIRKTEICKGYAWGIETIAKIHPEKIKAFDSVIMAADNAAWLKRKYKLGLQKSVAYARKRS